MRPVRCRQDTAQPCLTYRAAAQLAYVRGSVGAVDKADGHLAGLCAFPQEALLQRILVAGVEQDLRVALAVTFCSACHILPQRRSVLSLQLGKMAYLIHRYTKAAQALSRLHVQSGDKVWALALLLQQHIVQLQGEPVQRPVSAALCAK